MILEIFVVCVGLVLLKDYWTKRQITKKLNLPTVRNEWPIIGHGHWFLFRNTEQIMKTLVRISADKETPSIVWFGPQLTIVVNKPDDMKAVLMSPNCLQKPYVYDFIGGISIFNSPAHIWKKDRKAINPTFNNKILNSFFPIFNEKVEMLVNRLELQRDRSFDISHMMFACTLEMICATTLGHNVEVQSDKNQGFLESMELITEVMAQRIAKVWLHPQFLFRLSSDYRSQERHLAKLYTYSKGIRKIKETEFNESNTMKQEIRDDEEYSKPQTFVYEMLKLYNQDRISLETLDDQIMTIIIGGNETSALTTSHLILLLAMHQDIQERVFNELSEVYDDATSPSTLESISKLDYLEQVIKETMRLLPVGPFLARECLADTEITTGTIPTGTMVMLDIHHLHRCEGTWGPDAHKFNPENFTPEKCAQRHPFSYLPFSGGARNCVGMKYGWIAMKIMLARILRRYKFTTELKYEDISTKWHVTMKLVGGHMVRLEKRDFN